MDWTDTCLIVVVRGFARMEACQELRRSYFPESPSAKQLGKSVFSYRFDEFPTLCKIQGSRERLASCATYSLTNGDLYVTLQKPLFAQPQSAKGGLTCCSLMFKKLIPDYGSA